MQPLASYQVACYDLTEKQYAIFSVFREKVLAKAIKLFPSEPDFRDKYSTPAHLIRLLVAREFQESKALEMWEKFVLWRREFGVDAIKESFIEGELSAGKAFWHKHDKNGHPCLIVKTARHFPERSSAESLLKFAVFLIETGTRLADEQGKDGKICVLWDRKGFSMKNFDKRLMGMLKKLSAILQDNYAERLDSIYILFPNWFFRTMFKLLKPFLNKKTKEKLKLIENYKELDRFFEKDCIMKEMGGTSEFLYQYKGKIVGELAENSVFTKEDDEEELKKLAKTAMKEAEIYSDSEEK